MTNLDDLVGRCLRCKTCAEHSCSGDRQKFVKLAIHVTLQFRFQSSCAKFLGHAPADIFRRLQSGLHPQLYIMMYCLFDNRGFAFLADTREHLREVYGVK